MKKDNNNFIRTIEIDSHRHRFVVLVSLIFFNILLSLSICYFLANWHKWYTITIGCLVGIYCLAQSILTIIRAKYRYKYEIYTDKIKIYSLWVDREIPIENIFMTTQKESIWDKIFKTNTHSLVLYVKDMKKDKIVLPFIKEDISKLNDEILNLSFKQRNRLQRKNHLLNQLHENKEYEKNLNNAKTIRPENRIKTIDNKKKL